MGLLKNAWELLLKYRNQFYIFFLINYILFFLIKTAKIPFFEFTSNKKIALIAYLFWAFQSFLVKKSLLAKVLIFLIILAILILDIVICFYLSGLLNHFLNNQKIKNKLNFIKSDYFIVAFLLIFSGILRFGFLNKGLYHHDSFQIAVAAEKTVDELNLYGIGGGREGVVLINSLFFFLFKTFLGHKSAEFSVNFTSALFGTLAVGVLYFISKILTNSKFVGFTSSMLYSSTPIFLSVSTFAKEHTLDVFTALLSVLFLTIGLKKNSYYLISLSGLFLSFLIFIRFPSILIIFSSILLIYNFSKISKDSADNKLKAILFFIIPFIIVIALYFFLESSTLLNEAKSNFNSVSQNKVASLKLNFIYSIDGIIFSLTLLGFLFSIAGFILLFRENRAMFYFALLFFAPLSVFYLMSKTVAHRFFVLPLVPLAISLSYTLDYIKKKDFYLSIAVFILLVSAFFVRIHPIIKTRHEFSAFKDLANIVNANTNPYDSVIILYGDDTPALNYYSKTPTKSCDYEPDAKLLNNFVRNTQGLLDRNLKVFISGACFGLGSYEERMLFLEFMNNNFRGSMVAEYISDDYHRGSIKPTIKKISIVRLYKKGSQKGIELKSLDIKH
ncbi:MAG: glycosyltransferase family 39 protein [Nanoarchaeota archaeon]